MVSVNYHYRMSRPRIPETPDQVMERRSLAVLVRSVRAALGWSQKDLADQLGLSIASIAKLELSSMRLTPENRLTLLNLFENAGVKFVYGPKSVTVALDDKVLSKLDPDKSLSLPKNF